jgi:hypothetical protein
MIFHDNKFSLLDKKKFTSKTMLNYGPQVIVLQFFVSSVCPSQIGLQMINCEQKVRLKLGVVCKCILGVSSSTSSSIMTIFGFCEDSVQSYELRIYWIFSCQMISLLLRYTYRPHLASIWLFVHNLSSANQFGMDTQTTQRTVVPWDKASGDNKYMKSIRADNHNLSDNIHILNILSQNSWYI